MKLVPVTLTQAKQMVAAEHRHNLPPQGWLFGVGLENGEVGKLVGVAIAGRPLARMLQDGTTVEITRVVTDGTRNANSKLYGAVCRAAAALGYQRAITYTLVTESGVSLKAAGFVEVARIKGERHWGREGRLRHDVTIWGDPILPLQDRIRWERSLAAVQPEKGRQR